MALPAHIGVEWIPVCAAKGLQGFLCLWRYSICRAKHNAPMSRREPIMLLRRLALLFARGQHSFAAGLGGITINANGASAGKRKTSAKRSCPRMMSLCLGPVAVSARLSVANRFAAEHQITGES